MPVAPLPDLSFEEAAEELEALVEAMENSVLPLEQMLASYERGVKLAQQCARRLSDAEKRIELIKRQPDGAVTLTPLDVSAAGEAVAESAPATARPAARRPASTAAAPENTSPVVNDDEDDDELSLF